MFVNVREGERARRQGRRLLGADELSKKGLQCFIAWSLLEASSSLVGTFMSRWIELDCLVEGNELHTNKYNPDFNKRQPSNELDSSSNEHLSNNGPTYNEQ
jgi:hypothetical protein